MDTIASTTEAARTPALEAPAVPHRETSNLDRWRAAVAFAVMAPSSHNSQPWLFHAHPTGDALELYADRARALPVVDPDDRELVISCGAALFHLRVALRCFGHDPQVELLPDPDDRDLLARVRFGDRYTTTGEDLSMLNCMPKRRTVRRVFDDRPVPDALLARLVLAARAEGADLLVLRDAEARERAADLAADADWRQGGDRAFRRELAAWIHPNRSRSGDGMPGYAFSMGTLASYFGPFVVRTFDWGGGRAARDRELALGSPAMAVLSTVTDDARGWIAAGQALAHVLLLACANGVSASFLNQPLEVPALRQAFESILEVPGHAQLLLRMGYGAAVPPTPRRSVDEVFV